MKKSFKKAGAAVLSMAMLLSMGAVTMPVFAAPTAPGTSGVPTNDSVNPYTGDDGNFTGGDSNLPGAVYISMPGMYKQGEGDGRGADEGDTTGWKYQYLGETDGTTDNTLDVTKAKVSIYKVAELDGTNGWKWAGTLNESEINALLTNTGVEDDDGNEITNPTSFQKLLQQTDDDEFATKSADLKKLASYLERHISDLGAGALMASKEFTNDEQGTGFSLPEIDPALMTAYTDPATKDKIGYYLIVTETDQAGVLVQPVLISLKNGQENPKNISLKGSTINIEKRITHVGTEDTMDNTSTTAAAYGEGAAKDGIKDNNDDYIYGKDSGTDAIYGGTHATVGKNDVVHYEISAQLPQYDEGLDTTTVGLEDFVIHDVATQGITIIKNSIKAYISEADESKATTARNGSTVVGDNWYLVGSETRNEKDYSVTMGADNHSFDLTITLAQMRGKQGDTETSIGKTTAPDTTAAYYTSGYNAGNLKTMENNYIIVSFDAVVNYKNDGSAAAANDSELAFRRGYVAPVEKNASGLYVAPDGVSLQDIYDEWVTYADTNSNLTSPKTHTGSKEAIMEALIGGTYDADLAGAATTVATLDDSKFVTVTTPADAEHPTTDEANAIAAEKAAGLLLAIDYYNARRNGETNYADMTYGNNYSTGKGKAKDTTNLTKLNSVDMNLKKYVEKLMLDHVDPDTITLGTLKNYVSLAELKAWANDSSNAEAIAAAADGTTDDVTALTATTAYNVAATELGADDTAQKALAKAAKAKIAEIKANLEKDKEYASRYQKEVVKDAVFKLERVIDSSTTPVTTELVGYAVSTADGTLKVLKATANQALPSARSTEATGIKYWEEAPDNTGKYIVYTLEASADNAWSMFQQGDYQLTEVYAPTGFKRCLQSIGYKCQHGRNQR